MFTFVGEDKKTYEVSFRYPGAAYKGFFKIKNGVTREAFKKGRFAVTCSIYEYVGEITVPHTKHGLVRVPEKSLMGEQIYVVPLLEHKCSRKQARERALSKLLQRKGFSRVARLAIFERYLGKIHSDRVRAIMRVLDTKPLDREMVAVSIGGGK